ncbi:neutral sphingomyelinase [Babesia ovata]|uniref:Neutral sphingomyelinase n=1 Tax=Babesia ovata TaxID=189622 RepID=A0A2H6KA43_9APIC|nr:neutral sphingomyelinase [Babesia ovata]GBE59858.1 neutral sphingomyelinase [Babesia ovata]
MGLPGFVFIFAYPTDHIHDEQLSDYLRVWNAYKQNVDSDDLNTRPAGSFNQALLQPREKPLLGCSSSSIHTEPVFCWRLKRMVRHGGYAALTDRAFYFEPSPNFSRKSCKRVPIDRILHIFKRDSGMPSKGESATALEIISLPEDSFEKRVQDSRKLYGCIYLQFKRENDREKFTSTLKSIIPRAFFALESRTFRNEMTQLWRRGILPNFQYIDFLNCISGRSRYDMSHYPIFPWVISDYDSATLDLKDPTVFRDLSKPIGALNPERLVHLKTRMSTLHQADKSNNDSASASERDKCTCSDGKCDSCLMRMWNNGFYLYCSHYSTPALVVFFLIRLQPECQLRLYSGKFDSTARTFKSISETFHNVLHGHSTFFELIPEFYSGNDAFLRNQLNITTQDGRLCDVELPRWAGNSSSQFMKMMRSALESEHVSKNLHKWIDLIFGCKQAGLESIKSDNTFHPLSYLSSVRVGKMPMTRATQNLLRTMEPKAISVQVREFGQAPIILFETSHSPRLRHPHWQETDDPVDSAPWFIYVKRHSEIFGGGDSDAGEGLRLGRTISQGCSEGHLRQLVTTSPRDKVRTQRLGHLGNEITGAGFAAPDIVYSLSQNGSIQLRHIDKAETVVRASIDRRPLTCATSVMGHLCVCSSSGNMTMCNLQAILSVNGGFPLSDPLVNGDVVKFGDADEGGFFYRKQLHADGISCVSFGDGVLTSGGFDETVKQFQLTNSDIRLIGVFDETNGPLAALSSANGLLLTASISGSLTLWDPRSPHIPIWNHEIRQKAGNSRVVACGISNRYIQLVSTGESPVIFWDVRMLNSLSSCSGFKRELASPQFSILGAVCDPNDCVCLSGTQGGAPSLQLHDLHTRSMLMTTELEGLEYPTIMAANEFGGPHRLLVANTSGENLTLVAQ